MKIKNKKQHHNRFYWQILYQAIDQAIDQDRERVMDQVYWQVSDQVWEQVFQVSFEEIAKIAIRSILHDVWMQVERTVGDVVWTGAVEQIRRNIIDLVTMPGWDVEQDLRARFIGEE